MVRTPEGSTARDVIVTVRITPQMKAIIDSQRRSRGGMSLSTYLRWLVTQDTKRIEQEQTSNGA